MIRVKNLLKKFNGQIVLNQVDLQVNEGELIVILGESGSGKSIFLKTLVGILKPDQGEVSIDGKEITRLPEKELLKIRQRIGFLFQDGALYDFMTVYENVSFPLKEHTDLQKSDIQKKVSKTLGLVGLQEAKDKFPSELSGGMKKRAALARAIVLESKILFCDEPTSGLDPVKSRGISDLIKDIVRQLKCTTVVTSHDVSNSLRIADRVALIHDGTIVFVGTPREFVQSSLDCVRDFLIKEEGPFIFKG